MQRMYMEDCRHGCRVICMFDRLCVRHCCVVKNAILEGLPLTCSFLAVQRLYTTGVCVHETVETPQVAEIVV